MITIWRFLILFLCSSCWVIVSSCAMTPNITDQFPSFVCKKNYLRCEMVVGIESPNNNSTVKYSEPIMVDSQDIIEFLCNCNVEKVRNVKFFGMFCIRLYYQKNEYDLLVLSKNMKVIKFNGTIYRIKEEDAKNLDRIITNMIGNRRLVPASLIKRTD